MKELLVFISILVLTGCVHMQSQPVRQTNVQREPLHEYCFDLREHTIGMEKITTFVDDYREQRGVLAAMNGMYWGADDGEPQGVAHTVAIGDLASGKGLISGYFVIDQEGARVTHVLQKTLDEYFFVIGTHPLLLQEGNIQEQALAERYNREATFRSALGTKSATEVCFVVSGDIFTMQEWAQLLGAHGYYNAINLDGGSVAQLASPDGLFGPVLQETRLVLFVE